MLNITTNKGITERLVRINDISVLDPLILGIQCLEEERLHSEYAACKILKAERMLDARLRMLIGALYLEAGESAAV